jgi:photosystem II stability/assembly factor-like uncharacterized protein
MRRTVNRIGGVAALLTMLALALAAAPFAQAPATARNADFLLRAYGTYQSMARSSPYRSIPWQYLGPTNVSGRTTDIAVANRAGGRRIYAAYATSGLWKTDDNGVTWQSIFDDYATSSIGDIAVAPSNPDILWVGTGEANLFRASMPGTGIFKSTDAGRTFSHSGLTDTQTIARIVVHPTDPNTVYVAASGHGWTENEMRGVFKTTDGGRTWNKVLYKSPKTGAIDLVMDPSDPDTLYAALWQRTRRKWSDPRTEPGSSEGGISKSTDGGRTWTDVSDGLPAAANRGRIGLDVSRSNPNVLYAFLDNYEAGRPPQENERDAYGRPIQEARIKAAEIYRTDDKGKTWRKVSESNEFMTGHSGTYGWVFGQMRVDPADENTIYTLGLGLNVSRDAGKTFTSLRGMHGDHHALWIDPANPSILYNGNDGGFYWSSDAGKTWTFARAAAGAQFYNVTVDTSSPAWAYGSVQDHGSYRGKVDITAGRDKIPAVEFSGAPGGEGSFQAIDPANVDVVYSHGFYGNFSRTDQKVQADARAAAAAAAAEAAAARGAAPASPAPAGGRGRGRGNPGVTNIRPPLAPGDPELRAQWMAPILASVHEPGVIYAGFQFVMRSPDKGATWQKISPDLTSNDPSRMLLRSSNAIPYQTITALAESPRKKGLLYAGTDDGKLHVTMDEGKTWTDLTARVPTGRWYSRVVPSQHDDGTVYVTQRGREDDDFGVYVYKSTDYGKSFTSLASNVPAGSVNVVREDPADPNTLYLGTDFGAFVTRNGGRQWHVLGTLPSVQVSDLGVQARDSLLVISTYGRGMYAMDALKVRAVR